MKKIVLLTLSSLTLIGLTGCVPMGPPTTILPMGANHYQAITSTNSRSAAYEASLKHATAKCNEQQRNIVVSSSSYRYTGPNQDQRTTQGAIGAVASILSHGQDDNNASDNEYNEVTLKFKCVR